MKNILLRRYIRRRYYRVCKIYYMPKYQNILTEIYSMTHIGKADDRPNGRRLLGATN